MNKKIWVIDDDPIYRMIIAHNIKIIAPDAAITEFESVIGLVDIINEGRINDMVLPDVIFLDINLPEMDAWDFLEKIDDDEQLAKSTSTKIIVVSSSINPYDKSRAMKCSQVKAFESKPLGKERIFELLNME
jgi:CheY-like chemotaxis protein